MYKESYNTQNFYKNMEFGLAQYKYHMNPELMKATNMNINNDAMIKSVDNEVKDFNLLDKNREDFKLK